MRPKKKSKARMGRPPMPAGTARTELVAVRISANERQRLEAEAKRRGMTMTDVLLQAWRERQEER